MYGEIFAKTVILFQENKYAKPQKEHEKVIWFSMPQASFSQFENNKFYVLFLIMVTVQ